MHLINAKPVMRLEADVVYDNIQDIYQVTVSVIYKYQVIGNVQKIIPRPIFTSLFDHMWKDIGAMLKEKVQE